MPSKEAAELAEKFPYLGLCHRCEHPTEGRRRNEPPFVCGQCHHDIFEVAGRAAVREYLDENAR